MTKARIHYAWVILVLCFLGVLSAQGVRLAFGAFVQPWEQAFLMSRAEISLISLTSYIVYGLTQPIVGKLIDRLGVRAVLSGSVLLVGVSTFLTAFATEPGHLFWLYGLLTSIGFGGAAGVTVSVAVTHWFEDHRGVAFAIVEAGFGAGQLLLAPVSLLSIERWGWAPTVMGIGAILAMVISPILLLYLRSFPSEMDLQPLRSGKGTSNRAPEATASPGESQKGTLVSWAFWGLAIPFFVCGVTTTGLMDTHLIPYAHDHGFSTSVTSAAVGLLAAFNILGTLASGPLADRWDNRKILGALYSLRALSIILLYFAYRPEALIAFSILFGIVDFATVAPTQMLASKYFSGRSVGVVFGLLSLVHQIGSALGSYVPGVVYTSTGSYDLVLIGSVVALAVAALLPILLPAIAPSGSGGAVKA